MKRKPIKIDWDQLDEAFHRKHDEVSSYLDVVTGHVVLDGEGEDDDLDDDDYTAGPVSSPGPPRDDATRIYVHPAKTPEKIEWLKGFLDDRDDSEADVAGQLVDAISASDPARAIGDILNQNPEIRDAWYVYRADRVHERIEKWLAEHEIEPIDPPPWR
jgi:hypothetical protein